ncbi:MAG: prepilin-type N-terminal cleavage/methylation domain-containing protein [Patescibacteria group bacterium]|nr:prepilin-type N-terminal cleavage/methylation domain-containing protein [Patescibacteria group bacterium]MDE2438486.1 prepilin-type N-terminal cleavage/methylation domain-containing protein [Patescibacteria group bacterium]
MVIHATHSQKGFSLLEVLIALSIATLGLFSVVGVAFKNQSALTYTQHNNEALTYAQENLESAKAMANNNFSSVISSTSTENIFFKELDVTDVASSEKQIISRVSWKTDPLRTEQVELSTLITDWRSIANSTSTQGQQGGGGGSQSDWGNPVARGSVDIGSGSSGGYSGTSIAVQNNVAYVTVASGYWMAPRIISFISFDVTNPDNPQVLWSMNTGNPLNDVSVSGNYAFAASQGSTQLQIIDISNPSFMRVVSSARMNGVTQNGKSIFVQNGYAYIGSFKSPGGELQVFNVTNPLNPVWISTTEINADVNAISKYNNLLFVATSDHNNEVIIFDATNPSSLQKLGVINFTDKESGLSLFSSGPSTLFTGIGDDFIPVDITVPNTPVNKGRYDVGGVPINGIAAEGTLAFLATENSSKEFQVIDISNLSNPNLFGSLDLSANPTGIVVLNNIAYLSMDSTKILQIISPSN